MADQSEALTPSQMFRWRAEPPYQQLLEGHVIRLIHLAPGVPQKQISIGLSTHLLEHAPAYEAISYVWGDAPSRSTILCNGQPLSITESLASAFRQARLTLRTRTLWADAICINQGDPREKSHHVAFMNKVYSRAESVLICLGAATDRITADILALIAEHERRMQVHPVFNAMPVLSDDDPIYKDQRWKSLAWLMRNPWFFRAWVIQEAGTARNPLVLYGTVEFSYRKLMQLTRWIVRCASQLQIKAGVYLETIHTDWEQWSDGWEARQPYPYGIVDLLNQAKCLGCQDMRDHIYAFLGHPLFQKPNDEGPVIDPDYSLSTKDVFRKFTEWLIPIAGMVLFSAIEHDEDTIQGGMPSWVPRWSMNVVQNSLGYYQPFYYRASGDEPDLRSQPCSIVEQTCNVSVLPIDTVLRTVQFSREQVDWDIVEAATALQTNNLLVEVLISICHLIADSSTSYLYLPGSIRDALSLTLCAGLTNYEQAETNIGLHRADRNQFWTLLKRYAASSETPILQQFAREEDDRPPQGIGSADRYFYDLSLACKGRCFFVTESGYCGVGPWIMKADDECVLIRGARVAFLLRSVQDRYRESKQYRVLGEAYLHGIMDGELVREPQDVNWQSVSLV